MQLVLSHLKKPPLPRTTGRRAKPVIAQQILLEPFTEAVLIVLFLWATVAVIRKKTSKPKA